MNISPYSIILSSEVHNRKDFFKGEGVFIEVDKDMNDETEG